MSELNYLLLGWKPLPRHEIKKFTRPRPENIPGTLPVLASGDAKTVIAAACAADCGVLLFDCAVQTTPK